MKYKILIFDADETLFDFKLAEKEALKKTIQHFGIEYNESKHLTTYSEINLKIWGELDRGEITQQKLKTERFKRFFKAINLDIDAQECATIFMNYLAHESHLFKDSMKLVKELYKRNILIMLTNGLTKVQSVRIKQSPIAKYFSEIVISEEVGVSKPNPAIFDVALKNYKAMSKESILMIGDNLGSDILGGVNYGIDTLWYNPNHKQQDESINPTYECSDLMSIIKVVE